MFEPVRGGTRGGQAEFKWSDVSADKDREHYLGHSINAPTGRWQKNKDVHWYNRDSKNFDEEKAAEIKRIKQLEADALAVALGFEPAPKNVNQDPSASGEQNVTELDEETLQDEEVLQRAKKKVEKLRRKAERQAEKAAKKQAKLERKASERGEGPENNHRRSGRYGSRSRSPHRQRYSRSPGPSRDYSGTHRHRQERRTDSDYDSEDREKERERDRRRWESNSRRNLLSNR